MRRCVVTVFVCLATAFAATASAQRIVSEAERESARGVPDRWGFSLGSFWQTFDTRLRLDGRNGETGTSIDIETDLGLPSSSANLGLAGFYRWSDRSRVDLWYCGWSRGNSRMLDRQITWGDVTYDVGATVKSDLSGQVLNAVYQYSFVNNEKVTFGLNGGLSILRTSDTLSGEGTVSGGEDTSEQVAESETTIFPIPVLGVHFEMALAPKLIWKASGNFFAASIAGYDSQVSEIGTSISYYFTRNVGAGVGFSTMTYRTNTGGSEGGEFDARFKFTGATAYLVFVY